MARVTVEDCVDKIPNRFDLVLLAAQRANWGPIQFEGELHDRATYRYYWELIQRIHVSGQKLPEAAEKAFFSN